MRLVFTGDGNSSHLRRWMEYFADRGHEIALLVPDTDELRAVPDPRIAVHRFATARRVPLPGGRSLGVALDLRARLRALRPDVLHAHYLTRYGTFAWLSRFHPYVLTVWGSDLLVSLSSSRAHRIEGRLALRSADLVTGGSRHLVERAVRAGARPDRTRFVHFGVDTERFSPGPDPAGLRARLGLEGRRVVLSNRGLAPIYRQETVVAALPALPGDVAVLMTRHLARPEALEAVSALAARLGVADRLRIVDGLADAEMPDLYRLADVVVSVPASDGGPTTVAEALAAGTPVVATDLAAVREWLEPLDSESLVPVDDPAATAAALCRVLDWDRAKRHAFAERAREAVVAVADRRANMVEMERLYRMLAERSRR